MINLVNDLLSPFQKSTGAESPPILTEFGGETNAAGELPDENERNMPSLRIEEPGSPFLPDSTEMCKSVEECVRVPVVIEVYTTMEMPAQPTIQSKYNAFSSDEDSDGSVGCREENKAEKKGLFVFLIFLKTFSLKDFFSSVHEADQASQWTLISKELKEQYPPLACTPVSQQPPLPFSAMSQQHPLLCTPVSQKPPLACTPVLEPPPLIPIIGNSNLALQESVESEPIVESVEEVIVTGTFSL